MSRNLRTLRRPSQDRNFSRRRIVFEHLESRTLLAITATKEDALLPADDLNGNGSVDPGEVITYTVTISNPNGPTAQNLKFSDVPDPNTTLLGGSVTTTVGTVTSGNAPDDIVVGVDLGTFTAAGTATVRFRARVNPSLPAGVAQVSNQGRLDFSAPVHTPVLGQCYSTSAASNLPLGQQFFAANSLVSSIDLFLEDAGSDIGPGANFQVRLRLGSITGPILGTSPVTFVPDGTNTGGGTTATHFNFPTPVQIPPTAAGVFEIVQVGTIVPGNFNFSMCGVTRNSYLEGQAIRDGVLQPDLDFWFRIGATADTRDPAIVGAISPTITPIHTNAAPLAADDAATTGEDTPVLVDLLGNDRDPDGDTLSIQVITPPAHGTLAPAPGGTLRYTPAADYFGPDSFVYAASDGSLASPPATVTLTVLPINDPPVAGDGEFVIDENSPAGSIVGVAPASDVDDALLEYAIVAGDDGGAFAIDAVSGQIRVANAALLDFESTPTFDLSVEVKDAGGASDTGEVTIRLRDLVEIMPLAIDVRPGDPANEINLKSKGKFDVAIYSTPAIDALSIDVSSLRFGRTGLEDSLSRNPHGPRFRYADLNGDGQLDLLVTIEIELTGFTGDETRGLLSGRTFDGTALQASDAVALRRPGK